VKVDKLIGDTRTDGKRTLAPCGHPGVHVTTNYIKCEVGCDKQPKVNARADTEPGHGPTRAPCLHNGVMNHWNNTLGQMQNRCIDCGVLLLWDDDNRKWRAQ
jgi:hypothetical protein